MCLNAGDLHESDLTRTGIKETPTAPCRSCPPGKDHCKTALRSRIDFKSHTDRRIVPVSQERRSASTLMKVGASPHPRVDPQNHVAQGRMSEYVLKYGSP